MSDIVVAPLRPKLLALAQVRAIARRDLRVQLTYHLDLALQLESVVFAVGVALFMSRLIPPDRLLPYTGGYFDFALVGLMATLLSGVGLTTFASSFADAQREGTLETLLMGPVRSTTILVGTLVLPLTLATIEVGASLGIGIAFGLHLEWAGLVVAIPVFGLLLTSFGAFGILSAAVVVVTKRGNPFLSLMTQAVAVLGGALVPVSTLPEWGRVVAHLIPSYYGLNALRAALLPGGDWGDILPNVGALAAMTALLLPFSVWCLSRALRVARIAGTLGTY